MNANNKISKKKIYCDKLKNSRCVKKGEYKNE